MSETQARILTDYIKKNEDISRWYSVIFIMIHTGLRLGELIALRWCDVNLCENNVNIKVAQMLLGHKDITTTMDIYMRVSKEFAFKEYADKVLQRD